MATIAHEPVQKAMSRIRELSADEEARYLAFVRERALRDEISFLNEARREGLQEGLQEGEEIGIKKGEEIGIKKGEEIGVKKGEAKGKRLTARNLLESGLLTADQVAEVTGLTLAEVVTLREGQTD